MAPVVHAQSVAATQPILISQQDPKAMADEIASLKKRLAILEQTSDVLRERVHDLEARPAQPAAAAADAPPPVQIARGERDAGEGFTYSYTLLLIRSAVGGEPAVQGVITNGNADSYKFVTFRLNFYDTDGKLLSSGPLTLENLKAGEARMVTRILTGIPADSIKSWTASVDDTWP